MVRPALVALCAATIATGAMAQSTGVAVCDDFLKKYEICINAKLSGARLELAKELLDEMQKTLPVVAKSRGPSVAEGLCKQTLDVERAKLGPIGCTF